MNLLSNFLYFSVRPFIWNVQLKVMSNASRHGINSGRINADMNHNYNEIIEYMDIQSKSQPCKICFQKSDTGNQRINVCMSK